MVHQSKLTNRGATHTPADQTQLKEQEMKMRHQLRSTKTQRTSNKEKAPPQLRKAGAPSHAPKPRARKSEGVSPRRRAPQMQHRKRASTQRTVHPDIALCRADAVLVRAVELIASRDHAEGLDPWEALNDSLTNTRVKVDAQSPVSVRSSRCDKPRNRPPQ